MVGKGYNCQLKQMQFSNLNPWGIIYFWLIDMYRIWQNMATGQMYQFFFLISFVGTKPRPFIMDYLTVCMQIAYTVQRLAHRTWSIILPCALQKKFIHLWTGWHINNYCCSFALFVLFVVFSDLYEIVYLKKQLL